MVTTEHNIPVAATFTGEKQVDEETAMRVTRDVLAIEIWLIGDSAFDILNWHDLLLAQNVVPVAPYNPRNTNDPLNIEYRVESRIKEHFESIDVWQTQLDEPYAGRSQGENTVTVCKDGGLGQ